MSVTRVPGYRIRSHELASSYVEGLQACQSTEALTAFVARWQALYALEVQCLRTSSLEQPDPPNVRATSATVKSLSDGTYDSKMAYECLLQMRESGECDHITSGAAANGSCAGMCITVPYILILVGQLSKEFGAPDFTILHQLACKDPNHEGCF
jgi:hypothetical protein